jgi:hypothetical protein
LSQNDVLGLNAEYERWLTRTQGLSFPRGVTQFDVFCAEQFLKSHVLFSDQDVLSGLVGKSDDGGIDGFYFILNGILVNENTDISQQQNQTVHLVLLQTKEGQGFSPTSVDKFDTFTDDLLDLTKTPTNYGRKYHRNLRDKIVVLPAKTRRFSWVRSGPPKQEATWAENHA